MASVAQVPHSNSWIIINARVVTPHRVLGSGFVCIENGRVTAVRPMSELSPNPGMGSSAGRRVIDAAGAVVAPGFIDLHVHGGGGADVMDSTPESFRRIATAHAAGGTTGLLPTTLTSSDEDLCNTLAAFRLAKRLEADSQAWGGSALLGLHLEGPYFALSQKGAQDPRYLKNPDPAEYLPILDEYPEIRRWSVAPELPGAFELGRELRRRGLLASMGHTDADYDTIVAGLEAGYTHLTHFYSAMSGVRRINCYRVPGAVEAGYLLDALTVEIIADGHHLPVPLLQLVYKVKGPDRVALVTDAMRAAGMPDGEYVLGSLRDGQKIVVDGGVGWLLDRTSFASSVATFNVLVRTMVKAAGVPLVDAIKMASTTPARLLGLARKGALAPGMDADIVVLDDDFAVNLTAVQGRIVYAREGFSCA